MYGARLQGTQKLTCELTLRNGKVVYDLNGISRPDWEKLPKDYLQTGDPKWDGIMPQRRNPAGYAPGRQTVAKIICPVSGALLRLAASCGIT